MGADLLNAPMPAFPPTAVLHHVWIKAHQRWLHPAKPAPKVSSWLPWLKVTDQAA